MDEPNTEAGRELLADLAYTRDNYLGPILDIEREAKGLGSARCSGLVCIEGDCKRHSWEDTLYCGEHGGLPEYVTDPGHPENPNGKIIVLPPDPMKDAAALLERWLYVGSMTRPDIDALEQQTEEWIHSRAVPQSEPLAISDKQIEQWLTDNDLFLVTLCA